MTSALEKIDATTVKLTVSLTAEEVKPAFDHAYEHVGASVQIPGFRKGKVPPKLVEQRVGKGAIIEHAINDAMGGWYADAVTELDVRPYGQPEIEVTKIPGSEDGFEGVEFTATVEVRPEITLPAPASLTIEVDAAEATDEDVEQRLTTLRQRFGSLVTVDRAAAEGDFVTIDLSAVVDGQEVDAVQGTSYQVGTGNMIEGLDAAVTGLKAGEETTFEGPLAAGEHAGTAAKITVKVTAVRARELPEADDDFAQLASEFDTLDELKADLREQVLRVKLNNQAVQARVKMIDALTEAVGDMPMPTKIVEREVHQHLEGENRLEDDEHRAEITERAQTALRTQILLDQLADDLDIEVNDNEMLEYLLNSSRQYNMDPGEFIKQVQQAGQLPIIAADVARSKAAAFALRRATVKDTTGAVVDLSPVIGSLDDEAQVVIAEPEAKDAE